MLMLVSYDVRTEDLAGRRRLRRIAKACQNFGQRVQFSVFECEVEPAQWVELRAQLVGLMDERYDSLRFYHLGADGKRRIEHLGVREPLDLGGPLLL
ncbi:MAG: CRISPR-associated endonuclease Cas2 [Acidiphilium sp. 37-60-79]|nr:MAG: CRISPR-associated endonuclease Cas2 [Acidiphilium sp. 37-60-79]